MIFLHNLEYLSIYTKHITNYDFFYLDFYQRWECNDFIMVFAFLSVNIKWSVWFYQMMSLVI